MGTDEPSDQDRRRTLAERYADTSSRTAGVLGAATWGAAAISLVLYGHRWFLGGTDFTLTECLLIGAGCLGAPVFVAQLLNARRITPLACTVAALLLGVVTALLAILIAVGQLRTSVLVTAFVIIMPEAGAIHALNAAHALTRRNRAVEVALENQQAAHDYALAQAVVDRERDIRAAYLAGITTAHDYERDAADHVRALLAAPTDGLERAYAALGDELLARTGGHKKPNGIPAAVRLHLVQQRPALPATGTEQD
jgi:hypothetical protein